MSNGIRQNDYNFCLFCLHRKNFLFRLGPRVQRRLPGGRVLHGCPPLHRGPGHGRGQPHPLLQPVGGARQAGAVQGGAQGREKGEGYQSSVAQGKNVYLLFSNI